MTKAPTHVYELLNGGRISWSRIGVFTSIELAKEVAGLVLATYGQFDDDEGVEDTNFDAEWVMRRETIGPPSRTLEVGDPKPFQVYGSEGSAFKIDTIVLDQGRSIGEIIYPPQAEA